MTVWRGGRGNKAPYETTHVRIPTDIKERVEELSKAYKDGRLEEIEPISFERLEEAESMSFEQAIEAARKILKKKKSARISMESLLTAIYNKDICL